MSNIEFKLTANLDEATREVSGFRKEYGDLVRAVEKPLRQVNAFRDLETSIEKTGREMTTARNAVRALGDQLAAQATPTKKLQIEYRDATNQLNQLMRAETSQALQLAKMRRELQAAGIDTKNLTGEQKRLQSQLSQRLVTGKRDSDIQAAKVDLGVAKFSNTTAEIAKLQQQFQLLKSTGTLTGTELAIAQNTLRQSLANAATQTATLTGATALWRAGLADVRAELVAGAVAFGGFAVVAGNSFGKFAGFEQQIAAIGTITDLSDAQLTALSKSIRTLSRDMGKSAAESSAAVYDLLGSGVATADAMKVLEASTKAAVAGMAETKTAASVGVSIINAYGESMDKLGLRYDQLFLAIQNGVVTFDQLSAGLGQVLPGAAAAGVSFAEVSAAIAQMTVQGVQAPIAITALRSAINQLAAPAKEAKAAMKALGIEWNGFSGTLEQIARKNISFEDLRLIIPDTEGRTAIQALTQDYGKFAAQVEQMEHAGGTTEIAYNKMKDTPQAEIDKFKAAVSDLQISFGEALAAGLPLVLLLTDMLNAFNELPSPVKNGVISLIALGVAGKTLATVLKLLRLPFGALIGGMSKVSGTAATTGGALTTLAGKAGNLGVALGALRGIVGSAGLLIIAGQLAELYGIYTEMQDLQQAEEAHAKGIKALIAANAQYKDTLVLTSSELGRMTEAERKAYTERLRNAQAYYRNLSEQIARADFEKNGPTAGVNPEALAASKKAREYGEALAAETGFETQRVDDNKRFNTTLKAQQGDMITAVKAALKQRVAAEKAATAEIKKAKDAQLDTEKRYTAALAKLQAGPAKEASYGSAQALKVAARQALANGDIDGAKKKAQASLAVLDQLQEAGKNTYGFEGFIKELQGIENQADKMLIDRGEAKQKALGDQVTELKAVLASLTAIQITPVMSETARAQAVADMQALATELGLQMIIPVRITPTTEMQAIAGDLGGAKVAFPDANTPTAALVPQLNLTPAAAAAAKKPGLNQLGNNSYGQFPATAVDVEPEVNAAAMEKLRQQITDAANLTVPVEPVIAADVPPLEPPVVATVDQAALEAAKNQLALVSEQLRQQFVIPVVLQTPGAPAANDLTIPITGFARGDLVRGAGTGTSDSILARLSNGEFVMRAAAVQHYGPELLRLLNERRLPRFAEGGYVGFTPSIDAPNPALLQQLAPAAPEPFANLALTVGGNTYNVSAPKQEFDRIIRDQRIKFGKS